MLCNLSKFTQIRVSGGLPERISVQRCVQMILPHTTSHAPPRPRAACKREPIHSKQDVVGRRHALPLSDRYFNGASHASSDRYSNVDRACGARLQACRVDSRVDARPVFSRPRKVGTAYSVPRRQNLRAKHPSPRRQWTERAVPIFRPAHKITSHTLPAGVYY